MTSTPLSKLSIRSSSLVFLLVWMIFYALLFYFQFKFSWQISVVDCLVTNGFLALACIVISNMLGFYSPKDNQKLFVFLVSLAMTLLISFLSVLVLKFIFRDEISYQRFLDQSFFVNFGFYYLCLLWCSLSNLLWYNVAEQSEINERMITTQSLAKEAELNKLRHQLQPHFLFNSLNSVYALTITNPSEAGSMIMKLSSFLRGTLKRDDDIWLTVEDEMEFIQLYLDIEKVRFSHRLNVEIELEEASKSLYLPSTLLQPIVENAIKFGLYNTTSAITIKINVSVVQNTLVLSVSNPFDPDMEKIEGTGFGLSAIRRRLYLLFADSDLLQTQIKSNNLYITTLKIPQVNDKSYYN